MPRWVTRMALASALVFLAGCQASLSSNSAKKTSFDRLYEASPSIASFVNKSFAAQRPKRIAILPFVYRPRVDMFSAEGPPPVSEELEGEVASSAGEEEPQAAEEAQGAGPFVTVLDDKYPPGGFSPDAELVRRAFFGQFATLEYADVDMHEVDRKLREAGIITPKQLESEDPRRLGSLLGADAVMYGVVHEISVTYLVMYSQIAIGLSMQLVSTTDGDVLWQLDDVGRKHNIKIAVGPVGLVAGAVQNALALRPINVTRAAEDISRDIVLSFPTRASLAHYSTEPYEILSVEADGTEETRRYGEEITVKVTATPDRRAWFDLAPLAKNIGLQEVETGLYQGSYVVQEGDLANGPTLTVFLGPEDSPQYFRWVQKRLPVVVDTIPPHPPKGLRARWEGQGLLLLWEPSPSGDLKEYRLYRKEYQGGVALVGSTESTSYFVEAPEGGMSALVVTAVDSVGNESAGVEVAVSPRVSGIGSSSSR